MATAKVFYLAGFSLSLGNQVVNSFIAAAQRGLLVVNLSAPFVCRDFTEQLLDSMRQARLVVGNREEMAALYLSMAEGQQTGEEGSERGNRIEEMAKEITRATFSSPEQKLVVTGGAEPIMVVSTGEVSYIEVAKVERVVDSTGAGDAIAGALLAACALDQSIEEGLRWGQEEAAKVIQHVGALQNPS